MKFVRVDPVMLADSQRYPTIDILMAPSQAGNYWLARIQSALNMCPLRHVCPISEMESSIAITPYLKIPLCEVATVTIKNGHGMPQRWVKRKDPKGDLFTYPGW